MKKGHKSPDYEVVTDFRIDEETISEEELRLIETVIADIIRTMLDDKMMGGE
jgi:hypothetical protein